MCFIIVDMTTSEPSLAIEIAAAAAKVSVRAIDAPVSGGDVGAREVRLSIMIGGEAEAIEWLRPCWAAMGKTFVRQGGPGAGQHTKMVNQILIATNMIGVCEGLLYAQVVFDICETTCDQPFHKCQHDLVKRPLPLYLRHPATGRPALGR